MALLFLRIGHFLSKGGKYAQIVLIILLLVYSFQVTYHCEEWIKFTTMRLMHNSSSRCLVETCYCYLTEQDLIDKLARQLAMRNGSKL